VSVLNLSDPSPIRFLFLTITKNTL